MNQALLATVKYLPVRQPASQVHRSKSQAADDITTAVLDTSLNKSESNQPKNYHKAHPTSESRLFINYKSSHVLCPESEQPYKVALKMSVNYVSSS